MCAGRQAGCCEIMNFRPHCGSAKVFFSSFILAAVLALSLSSSEMDFLTFSGWLKLGMLKRRDSQLTDHMQPTVLVYLHIFVILCDCMVKNVT